MRVVSLAMVVLVSACGAPQSTTSSAPVSATKGAYEKTFAGQNTITNSHVALWCQGGKMTPKEQYEQATNDLTQGAYYTTKKPAECRAAFEKALDTSKQAEPGRATHFAATSTE